MTAEELRKLSQPAEAETAGPQLPTPAHPREPVNERPAETWVLLRGVGDTEASTLQHQDLSELPAARQAGLVAPSGRWVRAWRRNGSCSWNVVLAVNAQQLTSLRQAALELKQRTGIVVTPYLSKAQCAQRQAMSGTFAAMVQQGLRPRWRGACDIVLAG
ncbi:hypothetical protein HYH03_000337 [Edaphochlamys debaryana]|uniref:Uncharacterized protein n=1 Tax=Edaphochlamys debaryana TaxID=47281 RepID=A0A835YHE2_9CHLO|nr:hypothetical protein HYH03_000337 [Edaphochlamys debaryana]|eukprot:KAG2501839.1 hypothetical protein HYH03_000337 [Edaphochlamys debaryana]